MEKRGRPKQNGYRPLSIRPTLILYAYDGARKAGEKHFAAIEEAVKFVKRDYPHVPISKTEVRRVLSAWRPHDQEWGILVSKPDPSNSTFTLPDGLKGKVTYTVSVGPRPICPRANAATTE